MRNTGTEGRAWADFSAWCRRRGLRALPAHPWTVAVYARWCEDRHRYSVIIERIGTIARTHLRRCLPAPDRHPMVTRTLRMIERRAHGQNSALFRDADFLAPKNKPRRQSQKRVQSRSPKQTKGLKGLRTAPRLVPRRPASFRE